MIHLSKTLLFFLLFLSTPVFSVEFPFLQPYDRSQTPQAEFAIDMAHYIPGVTENEFKSKLADYGFVLLLNAVDPELIDTIHASLMEAYKCAENDPSLNEAEKKKVKNTHISETVLKKYTGHSFFELFDPRIHQLGRHFFSAPFHVNRETYSRRVATPKAGDNKTQRPIKIHIDAMYHGAEEFVLNFWTPMEDCGIDKPTMMAFVSSCEDNVSLMGFDRESLTFDPDIVASVEQGAAPFLQDMPSYYFIVNKGDMVVISNWTLHGGFASEEMDRPRTSVELRISADKFWY